MNMSMSRISVLSVLTLILGVVIMTFVTSSSLLAMFTQAVVYAISALGVGFLLRQNGLVSFGHALFFGAAGYGMGVILQLEWMSAEVAIFAVLAGLAVMGFLMGLVIVRVPGIAFGMLTLAIGQMAYLLATRATGMTGGTDGMSVAWPNEVFGFSQSVLLKPTVLFMIAWVLMVVVTYILLWVIRTRFGAITEAIRDNEERARFIGITTTVPRAAIFAISGVVTGIAGLLSSFNTGFVSPENLHWSLSGVSLMMVVVGGYKVLWGPALGAVVYFLAKDILGDYANHWMAIFGVALITVIVFSPTGIAGALQRLVHGKKAAPAARASHGH